MNNKRDTCNDCHCDKNSKFVDYVCVSRCNPCSDTFQKKVRAERATRDANAKCEECGTHTGSASLDYCEECCEHDFDPGEGNHCLSCGLEEPF